MVNIFNKLGKKGKKLKLFYVFLSRKIFVLIKEKNELAHIVIIRTIM